MKIASVAEVKSQFSAFLKATEGGPVVVTRNGRPVAVIVGVQDEDEIERLLMAYSPHLRAILGSLAPAISRGEMARRRGVLVAIRECSAAERVGQAQEETGEAKEDCVECSSIGSRLAERLRRARTGFRWEKLRIVEDAL